jgi:hypothetical protein
MGADCMTDYRTNGQSVQNILEQATSMVGAHFRSAECVQEESLPRQVVGAKLVDRQAQQAGLDALRMLLANCPALEREAIAPTLQNLFSCHDDLVRFLASCPPPLNSPCFQPFSLPQLLNRLAKLWFFDQVIGPGDIGMAFGPPGSAKTFGVIDMIFAGCLGRRWAMRFDVVQPLNIAYCAGEGLGGLPARFVAAAQHHEVDNLPGFTFFELTPQLFAEDSIESIAHFVAEWRERQATGAAQPLDILVIDTMHSATVGANENSAQDMGKVLLAAKHAIRELRCAVLLVHHSNKAGTGERGSSAMRGAMDVLIEFKPATGKYVMSCEKLKDAAAWKPQTFALVEIGDSARVWWDEPQDDQASNKQDKDVDAILAVLRNSEGTRYQASHIAEAIGIGGSKQIFKLLPKAMKADSHVQSGLKHPKRDASPHNPMVYWYANGDSPAFDS